MGDFKIDIYLMVIPMVAANVLHMFVVKGEVLALMAKPVHSKAFGPNKTWRAFIVLPLATAFFCWLSSLLFGPFGLSFFGLMFLGLGLGFSYLLFELPNSYFKRRMGLAAGAKSKYYPRLQLFIDKSDSLIGILIFYGWFFHLALGHLGLLYLLSLALHYAFSFTLYRLKIKKSV